jgi:hypothetical protein
MQPAVNRRDFVKAAGAAAVAAGCRATPGLDLPLDDPARLVVDVKRPKEKVELGIKPLGLGETREGDGFLFVPAGYSPSRPASLLVLLHGAGHTSMEWSTAPLETLFGSRNVAVLAPDSRGPTWDMMMEGFGPDVVFINRALAHTFKQVPIDDLILSVALFVG